MDSLASLPPDTVQRIFTAADELYKEGGCTAFPNVDVVRQRARTNMNSTSLAMRDWRQRHDGSAPALDEQLPPGLRDAAQQLVLGAWREALALASSRIQVAQAGWNSERNDQEEVRAQLAQAFDRQGAELAACEHANRQLAAQLQAAQEARVTGELAAQETALQASSTAQALSLVQAQLQEVQSQLRLAQHHQEQLAQQLRQQHADALSAAERNLLEQTRYARELGEARQEAALLRAQLDALSTSHQRAKPRKDSPVRDGSGKPAHSKHKPALKGSPS